jgi:hypothetical protein
VQPVAISVTIGNICGEEEHESLRHLSIRFNHLAILEVIKL